MNQTLRVMTAGMAVLAFTWSVRADVIAPAPLSHRVALADCIVVGKITAIENKTVEAKRYPLARQPNQYKVAVIAIEQGLKGAKGLTRLRLGFVPPPPAPPAKPLVISGRNRFPQLNHKVGQEALFFLTRHFEKDFFVAPMYYEVVEKKKTNLARDIATIKSYTKLLENPSAGLKSKNAQTRLNTAAMLLARYRTVPRGTAGRQQQSIPAEESKLILHAILNADWTAPRTVNQASPVQLFMQLGLTDKDGWSRKGIKNFAKEFPPRALQWLTKHGSTYRIKKFVSK